jgi:hypothetical protein
MKPEAILGNQNGLTLVGHLMVTLMLSAASLAVLILSSGESGDLFDFLSVKIKFLVYSALHLISNVFG